VIRRARSKRKPAWGKIVLIALLFAGLAAAWRYTPLSEYITADRIAGWARAVRETHWAPAVVILSYTPAAFVMFPRPLLTLFTVIAFGPWLGFAYGMTGILLAALATYYTGRVLNPDTINRLGGDDVEKITRKLRRHGLLAMFLVRIVPAAPFSVEGIIAGAARLKLWHYMLGTFLGMVPGVLATSVFGGQIANALEDPGKINYWIVGAVVVAMIGLMVFVRWWMARQPD
jgi:phospholipase D1/2